jgi:ribosome maturation factor RimP
MDVEALVRPVVETAGLELWEVTFRREGGRRVLRVMVDREGGVDLDTLSEASERVSRRLDLEGFEPGGSYALEVTSPGVERLLRAPEHFRRSVGEQVKVRTREPVDGSRAHSATLVSADDDGIVLSIGDELVRVRYEDVASARTVFDWGRATRQKNEANRGNR